MFRRNWLQYLQIWLYGWCWQVMVLSLCTTTWDYVSWLLLGESFWFLYLIYFQLKKLGA